MLTPIHVIGIGLDGAAGLTEPTRQLIAQSTLLVGSDRHLSYFPDYRGDRLSLSDLRQTLDQIHTLLPPTLPHPSSPLITILTSGDPLFFGLGRLLLAEFPSDQITFHPHLSSVQLAFSRVKQSWQDAKVISAHGRSLDELTQALQQGAAKIAVLTDNVNTPQTIARHLMGLDLPTDYQIWVCENLAGETEQVQAFIPEELSEVDTAFASLNVVILLRRLEAAEKKFERHQLPLFGLPDRSFLSFSDRPGLMTKREVRLLVLGELALQPDQTVWDIGAGTGSVSIEIARLCPSSQIYAIEQTAAGITLIQQNSQRFQVGNIIPIHGKAPDALQSLPHPDRIFIGGSSGKLPEILDSCQAVLQPQGTIVLALATLEHLTLAMHWLQTQPASTWNHHLLQVQLSRSVPVASLTRFDPLNPVTLITIERTA